MILAELKNGFKLSHVFEISGYAYFFIVIILFLNNAPWLLTVLLGIISVICLLASDIYKLKEKVFK